MTSFRQKTKQIVGRTFQIAKNITTSHQWRDRPNSLNFEITSICDSKCIHCPRQEMDRIQRPMPFELFKKMVDEAAELRIPELCPNGYGEIMTLKNVEQYLEYISSKDHQFKIVINTNGFRMTEDKVELLIKHRVSLLNICIDGATAETAEAVRIGLKLDQIEKNILRLMEIRRERGLDYPKIRVGFVQIPKNVHEVDAFVEKWRGKVDYVGVDGYSNRAGSLAGKFDSPSEKKNVQEEPRAGVCVLPFKDLNIWADGSAVLCCNDWNGEYQVGDLSRMSIKEIWQGQKMQEVRRLHLEKRGAEIKACKDCNYWVEPGPGVRLA